MKDLIIIGAGQAGLTMGYYLKQEGYNFLLLEAGNRVGDSWRNRYDSLQLFTPRPYSSLPGMALIDEKNEFPYKDEIATYLEEYARHFQLPIQLQTKVFKIKKEIYSNYIPLQKFYKRKKLLSQQVVFSNRLFPQFQQIYHHMFFKYIHHNINHHHKFLRRKYS